MVNRRPARAAASFERALALNPSHAAALHDYAWTLAALGRDGEAVARITAARDLDPLSSRANNDIGWLYLHLRQPAEALRACQHTLAIHEDSLEAQACLERAYVQRGMYDAALRAARATLPDDGAPDPESRTAADAEQALRGLWRWRLERLERAAATRWISPYTLATTLVMVGDSEACPRSARSRSRSAGGNARVSQPRSRSRPAARAPAVSGNRRAAQRSVAMRSSSSCHGEATAACGTS